MSRPAVLSFVLAVSALTVMAGAVLAPALPSIAEQYAAQPGSEVWVRLMLTLPGLAVAVGALPAGWLCDAYGRRGPMVLGLVLYGLAGGSGLWLDSLWALLLGRVVLGIAVALVMTAATSIITDAWDDQRRSKILGIQGATMALGGVLFLLLGGLLAGLSWRGPFAVYTLALPLLLPALLLRLPTPPPAVAGERPRLAALLPVLILAFLSMAAFYLIPVQVPFFIERVLQGGPLAAGAVIAVGSLASAFSAALLQGPVLRRWGPARSGGGALMLISLGLAVIGVGHGSWLGLMLGVIVVGLGGGMSLPLGASWATRLVVASARGRALGYLTAAVFFGQFASPLLCAPLLPYGSTVTFVTIAGGCLAVGLWLFLWRPRDARQPLTGQLASAD